MAIYIAFLRAVNVGGTGKLPMSDLTAICEDLGFEKVQTYIQSGNVVFETNLTGEAARAKLETRLHDHMGKPVGVVIREAHELGTIIERNPYPKADAKQLAVIFLNDPPPKDVAETAKGKADEEITPIGREIFVHYPSGMGRSRLKLAVQDKGTARNLNTVAKLKDMAEKLE